MLSTNCYLNNPKLISKAHQLHSRVHSFTSFKHSIIKLSNPHFLFTVILLGGSKTVVSQSTTMASPQPQPQPQCHPMSILRVIIGLAATYTTYILLNSGLLAANFPAGKESNPHFYYTHVATAMLLPTRYAQSFVEAAPRLTVITGVMYLRGLAAAALTFGSYVRIFGVVYW